MKAKPLQKLLNKPSRKRKLSDIIGEQEDRQPTRKYIRIPSKNLLPNKKVYLKEEERRGKHSKKRTSEENKKLQNAGIRTRNSSYFSVDNCSNCGAFADDSFIRTREYDVVCKKCGCVQNSEICFENEITTLSQTPTTNKKITYISERLRLFANREPRIAAEDINIIGSLFGSLCGYHITNRIPEIEKSDSESEIQSDGNLRKEIKSLYPYTLFSDPWKAYEIFSKGGAFITKKFVRELLRVVDKLDPEKVPRKTKSFEKKYTERWLQIKIYLMWGEQEFEKQLCKLPDKDLLDKMVYVASLIVDSYEKQKADLSQKKTNMLSIDLLFLLLLFQENKLEEYGWYFVSPVLHRTYLIKFNKINKAAEEDFQVFEKIFNILNSKKDINLDLSLPEGGVRELITIASKSKAYIF